MLEIVRRRLRDLVQADREAAAQADLHRLRGRDGRRDGGRAARLRRRRRTSSKFRAKARAFLREHQDHIAIHKLRMNKPLTRDRPGRAGADAGRERRRRRRGHRAGRRRSRRASGCSCARWSAWTARRPRRRSPDSSPARRSTANQIEFVNLIVDHLTEHGVDGAGAALRVAVHRPHAARARTGCSSPAQVDELVAGLEAVRATAVAA